MASETTIVIPSDRANIIQTTPGLPSVALQASGATPYPQYGAQQLGISTSAPQQVPQGLWRDSSSALERFLKAEPKVLGAVEIMIGLIHICFGAVSLSSFLHHYIFLPISAIIGYPFWGGIFFISSGSLCVAAEKHPNCNLVKSSVGMNITSAIMALIGVILYVCELIMNSPTRYISQYKQSSVGYGLSCVLLLFSMLEFCIAVSLAHFGCQATCCLDAQMVDYGLSCVLLLFSMLEFCIAVSLAHFGCQAGCCLDALPAVLFVPYQVTRHGEVTDEPNPPPPTYNNVVIKSQ